MINISVHFFVGAQGFREELRLLRELLTEYDPAVRPVKNLSDIVEIRMGVALFQIRELVSEMRDERIHCNQWHFFHSL